MANVLCLDFDDTVVLDNTWRQFLARFTDSDAWEEKVGQPRARGELSVEQANAAGLDLIDLAVTRDELEAFALEVARPREGLLELTDWAHWQGWLTVVVSLGFDFYVNPVLDRLGLDRVARHTGRASNAYRWRGRYFSPRGIEVEEDFKLSYARAFRDAGDFVVYVGDGESDEAPAALAPVVFARSTLWEQLNGQRPGVYPFETFHEVTAVLDREAGAWLAAFTAGRSDPSAPATVRA